MVVRGRKIQTDCKQSLRIGKIRALNGVYICYIRSINYSIFSIISSNLAIIVLSLISRDSVLVGYESFDRAMLVVPLPTEQEISLNRAF